MMYLPDVIKATCDMLEADPEHLKIRTYNIGEYFKTPYFSLRPYGDFRRLEVC